MRTVNLTLLLLLLSATSPADAITQVLLAPGVTSERGSSASLGLGQDWNRRWFESSTGHLSGYWHAGYTWWEGGKAGDSAHSISFSPVLVYSFHTERWQPFIEVGIGAAVFSRSRVGDRKLGTAAHFEDRFGAGVYLSEHNLMMLRVIHYSNAGLASRNQGIESWSLVYGRRF